MTMNIKLLLSSFLVAAILVSCGGEEQKEEVVIDHQDTTTVDEEVKDRTEKIENIFFNIPSPMETSNILRDAGASYEFHLPNNPKSADDYQSLAQQSLNMGVFGADLNYASVFDQTTETMMYLSAAQKLGKKLGLEQIFDEYTVGRIEDNVEDDDSMQVIISETFWRMDTYLKEDDRESVSALIVAGGWVEGVYLSTQLAKLSPDNADLKQRIAEQKYSIANLNGLLGSYPDNDLIEDIRNELLDLEGMFDKITESKTPGENNVDEDGVMVIGTKISLDMSNEVLTEITEKIAEIRNDIIN